MGGTPIRIFGISPVAILAGHRTVNRIVFEKGFIYEDLLVRSQRLHRIGLSPLSLGLQRDLGSGAPLPLQFPYRADQLARGGVAGDAVILPGVGPTGRGSLDKEESGDEDRDKKHNKLRGFQSIPPQLITLAPDYYKPGAHCKWKKVLGNPTISAREQ